MEINPTLAPPINTAGLFGEHLKLMNPITLKSKCLELQKTSPELTTQKIIASSPILYVKQLEEESGEKFKPIYDLCTPPQFNCFLFDFPFLERRGQGFSVFEDGCFAFVFTMGENIYKLTVFADETYIVHYFLFNKWHVANEDPTFKNSGHILLGVIFKSLSLFRSPLFVNVKSSPSKLNSKSVEWVKVREYYTVVHRKHEANAKGAAELGTYGDNTHKRIAHARKAHFRILRSEKWGKNQGRKVFVSATWVGPREWIDADSKQIYSVQGR